MYAMQIGARVHLGEAGMPRRRILFVTQLGAGIERANCRSPIRNTKLNK